MIQAHIDDGEPTALHFNKVVTPKNACLMVGTAVSRWISPAGGDAAGGDWCDVLALSDDAVALTVGDVSGHGEAVSGTAKFLRGTILSGLHEKIDPSRILSHANSFAYPRGTLITAIVGILDRRKRTLVFANAGHPPPVLAFAAGSVFLSHSPADLPLGVLPYHQSGDYVIALPDEALIVFYTDGITEHDRDPIRGEVELARAAQLVYHGTYTNAAHAIANEVLEHERGDDDAAVLAVRLHT